MDLGWLGTALSSIVLVIGPLLITKTLLISTSRKSPSGLVKISGWPLLGNLPALHAARSFSIKFEEWSRVFGDTYLVMYVYAF